MIARTVVLYFLIGHLVIELDDEFRIPQTRACCSRAYKLRLKTRKTVKDGDSTMYVCMYSYIRNFWRLKLYS